MGEHLALYLHYFIIITMLIGCIIVPVHLLPYYLVLLLSIIFHWYFLDGKCILSFYHKNTTKNKSLISEMFEKYNLDSFVFDIIVHSLILLSFYRLGELPIGVFFSLLILIINKIVYKTYNLKWC